MQAELIQLFQPLPSPIEAALRASIRRFGVLVPITKDQHGRVLDGHHRKQIADEEGMGYAVSLVTVSDDDEAREISRTLNADRRHLTEEQRREVALALRQEGHSYRAIAGALGISHTEVRRDVEEAVASGVTHVPPATVMGGDGKTYPARRAPVVVPSERDYERALSLPEPLLDQVATGERTVRTATQELHRQERIEAAVQRATDGSRTLPGAVKTYQTIVVDPPWAYERDDIRGAAEQHYDTMTFDEIAAYPVGDLAADNAHLYLWVTNPHMPHVWRIAEAWGFDYKTMLTWVKPQMGTGHYFRGATEHVLFCTRGTLPLKDAGIRNWFEADRTEHSAKPDAFYELVERASFAPFVELFARRSRNGWDVHGDEVSHAR